MSAGPSKTKADLMSAQRQDRRRHQQRNPV